MTTPNVHRRLAERLDSLEGLAIRCYAAATAALLAVGTFLPVWSFLAERGGDDDDWHAFSVWDSLRYSFGAEHVHSNQDYWGQKFSSLLGVGLIVLLVGVALAIVLCLVAARRSSGRVGVVVGKAVAVLLVAVSVVVFLPLIGGGRHPSHLEHPLWVFVAGVALFVALAFSPTLQRLARRER
ncbi:hypothetical protein CZ771_14415 [Actinomycetales bacterium JB111]|nr:hypothetical protein CZ771_14415 [Actinomycetales bacterium JB111]